jgi:Fe-S-cluster containining protein
MPTVSEMLKTLYAKFDIDVQKAATEMKATCTVGCNNCCMLLATASLPEGILIAEELLKKPDWQSLVPKLVSAAKEFCFDGVNYKTYLDKKIQCVFLKEGRCSIYPVRPSVCRYYYSVQDPKHCDPDKPDRKVATINVNHIQHELNMFGAHVAVELRDPNISAPIPLMVLYGMFIVAGSFKAKKFIQRSIRSELPMPMDYIRAFPSVLEEPPEQSIQLTEEEFKKLQEEQR